MAVATTNSLRPTMRLNSTQRAHMLARDYSNGHTALMVAAETGQEDIVDAVVKFMDETWGPSDHEVGSILEVPASTIPQSFFQR